VLGAQNDKPLAPRLSWVNQIAMSHLAEGTGDVDVAIAPRLAMVSIGNVGIVGARMRTLDHQARAFPTDITDVTLGSARTDGF